MTLEILKACFAESKPFGIGDRVVVPDELSDHAARELLAIGRAVLVADAVHAPASVAPSEPAYKPRRKKVNA
jgi:hypothetical protein